MIDTTWRYDCVSDENQARAQELELTIGGFSAQAHAAMARVAIASAEFDDMAGWGGGGIRSFEHWLSINSGFGTHSGKELLRVGHALKVLPRIAEAFAAGRLSFDKVREVTTVATPDTDELMLDIALGASGSQLARICHSLRRMVSQERDRKQLAERGLWSYLEEDGMMRIVARLPAEDGQLVMAAIESITGSKPLPDDSDGAVPDPAEDRWAACRADALVAMAEHVMSGGATNLVATGESHQVVVHVDVGVLTGETPDGVCQLENSTPLSAAIARRLGCDAQIVPLLERGRLPIDVGRKQRATPDRLRRALEARDRFCRYPSCGVPAHRTHAHHHQHWVDGGPTTLANMMLLCGFHHRRYHDGAFRIVKVEDGYRFETNHGVAIGDARDFAPMQPAVPLQSARAEWGGAPLEFDHTMWLLGQEFPAPETRAGPN